MLPPAARSLARLLFFHLGTPACGAPCASSSPKVALIRALGRLPGTASCVGRRRAYAPRGFAAQRAHRARAGDDRAGVRARGPARWLWRRDAEGANCCSAYVCVSCLPALPTDRRKSAERGRDDFAARGREESILTSAQVALVSWFVFPYEAQYPWRLPAKINAYT
jgi:hypothetical protein